MSMSVLLLGKGHGSGLGPPTVTPREFVKPSTILRIRAEGGLPYLATSLAFHDN
jgi:hypothetical protein